jgi:hypothetical protein
MLKCLSNITREDLEVMMAEEGIEEIELLITRLK